MSCCLVMEGGGMRGLFTAGVIDVLLNVDGKTVRVFSNGMVDISRYVEGLFMEVRNG